MKISIIGAGNVAWHLAPALESYGHQICEVFSREIENARLLCGRLYSGKAVSHLDFSDSKAELFILAVADDAIGEICQTVLLPENVILVHTSGSKTLEEVHNLMLINHDLPVRCGVFYPLMTFSKKVKLDLKKVPFCIEAYDEMAEKQLVSLAQELSNTVYLVSSDERKTLHLAAVFACNFTNHLLALAKEIVEKDELEFDLLKPLIEETLRKSLNANHPAEVQTGPAVRGDESIIHRHLNMLKNEENLLEIYEVMTESIKHWHKE